jgi:hypothetical protein
MSSPFGLGRKLACSRQRIDAGQRSASGKSLGRVVAISDKWSGKLPRYHLPGDLFLQFVAPVELRESVGSAARISYDRAPLVSAIGPLCISVMMLTDGWVLGFRGCVRTRNFRNLLCLPI